MTGLSTKKELLSAHFWFSRTQQPLNLNSELAPTDPARLEKTQPRISGGKKRKKDENGSRELKRAENPER